MKKFMYGIAAMSLAVAFTGCDDEGEKPDPGNEGECFLDSECGGYACDIADAEGDEPGVCLTECIGEAECADGYACNDAGECVSDGGEAGYNKVLIVSRTFNDPDGIGTSDCSAPNPGPDIDYVFGEKAGQTVYPTTASGATGDYCYRDEPNWASPDVALENLSIGFNESGEPEAGYCAVEEANKKYFFMGTGQDYEPGETIKEGTGFLLVEFGETFEDGDQIEVGEVGTEPGTGSDATCEEGPGRARPDDIYSIYLVSSDVASVGVGTELVEPDFVLVEAENIGLVKRIITLD